MDRLTVEVYLQGAPKKKPQCWKVGDLQEKQKRSKEDSSTSESCLEYSIWRRKK